MEIKSNPRSLVAYAFANAKVGDVFYFNREATSLTSPASYWGVKIKTEKMIALNPNVLDIRVDHVTKVTILEKLDR